MSRRWEARPRWRLTRGKEIALGPGKADLLGAIDRRGSISAAARALEMSYRRAWLLVETMNRCFGRPLVVTTRWRGRGASLSDLGREVLALYREMERDSRRSSREPLRRLMSLVGRTSHGPAPKAHRARKRASGR
ncbi:MAG: LysR family transcriptional regulator [Acidobacteria bacterium]|nr:MAG: LysR family transcriptional regulator [Acidobacteriota bacterium]